VYFEKQLETPCILGVYFEQQIETSSILRVYIEQQIETPCIIGAYFEQQILIRLKNISTHVVIGEGSSCPHKSPILDAALSQFSTFCLSIAKYSEVAFFLFSLPPRNSLSSFAHTMPTKLLDDAHTEETGCEILVSCNVKVQLLETSAMNRDMRT
jgi:hypothetical protein